jgi:hypothetical protein
VSRHVIREMKRAVSVGRAEQASATAIGLSKEAALHLLDRSIKFRHGRLAVIRLVTAVQVGADLQEAHWRHCREVVTAAKADPLLTRLFEEALSAAGTPAY